MAQHPLSGHTPHECHAIGCHTEVSPSLLMCRKHWRMVPYSLQRQVWAHYVKGQEVTKTPSPQYLVAAGNAIRAVALAEGLAFDVD